MTKLFSVAICSLSFLSFTGCGGGDSGIVPKAETTAQPERAVLSNGGQGTTSQKMSPEGMKQ